VCPYPHLAGVVCPSPPYPAGMTAATITFCGARARETGVTVPATTRRAASAATSAPREQAGTAGRTQRVPKNPLSGVQRPTLMRPCRRSTRQANSRRFHAGRLGRGTDIGAGFRHSGTTRTGPNDHPAHGRHRADDRPLPADRIAENGSGSRPGENQRARWTRILVTNPEGKN
jgi:hypothetical protein